MKCGYCNKPTNGTRGDGDYRRFEDIIGRKHMFCPVCNYKDETGYFYTIHIITLVLAIPMIILMMIENNIYLAIIWGLIGSINIISYLMTRENHSRSYSDDMGITTSKFDIFPLYVNRRKYIRKLVEKATQQEEATQ